MLFRSFTIYDDLNHKLWQEIYNGREGYGPKVQIKNGFFKVSLGAYVPLSKKVFTTESAYLGIKIGNDSEMSPRVRLLNVPYAFQSDNSETLDNLDSTQFLRSDIDTKLSANLLVTKKITGEEFIGHVTVPLDGVQSKNIIDKSIRTIDLADDVLTNSKVAEDAVTTDKIKDSEVKTADIEDSAVVLSK